MQRINKKIYNREDIIEKLKLLYKENKCAITYTKIKDCNYMPTIKVFDRIFGSLKNACLEANVPYGREKYIKRKSTVDTTKKDLRVGMQKYSNQGCLMTCIDYQDSHNVFVKFEDKYGTTVKTTWRLFENGMVGNPNINNLKIGEENYNNQGSLMKIVKYNNYNDVIIEFQDKYKYKKHVDYRHFKSGEVRNPYYPNVYNFGIVGAKYPTKVNSKITKEYNTWSNMIKRCFNKEVHKKRPTYTECKVCDEWLLFENFYEWLHEQDNFKNWVKLNKSALDKDILIKGNKVYSPDTCCLVPQNINNLLLKCDSARGKNPIGLCRDKETGNYMVQCCQNGHGNYEGMYGALERAFAKYKNTKERIIKEVATKEYENGNITKKCYEALLKYKVEIID